MPVLFLKMPVLFFFSFSLDWYPRFCCWLRTMGEMCWHGWKGWWAVRIQRWCAIVVTVAFMGCSMAAVEQAQLRGWVRQAPVSYPSVLNTLRMDRSTFVSANIDENGSHLHGGIGGQLRTRSIQAEAPKLLPTDPFNLRGFWSTDSRLTVPKFPSFIGSRTWREWQEFREAIYNAVDEGVPAAE